MNSPIISSAHHGGTVSELACFYQLLSNLAISSMELSEAATGPNWSQRQIGSEGGTQIMHDHQSQECEDLYNSHVLIWLFGGGFFVVCSFACFVKKQPNYFCHSEMANYDVLEGALVRTSSSKLFTEAELPDKIIINKSWNKCFKILLQDGSETEGI